MDTQQQVGNGQDPNVGAAAPASSASAPVRDVETGPASAPTGPAPGASPAPASVPQKNGAGGKSRMPWSEDDVTTNDYRTLAEGDMSPFHTKITRVFGRGRDFIVYENDSGRLAMHFNDPLPTNMRPALQECRRLTTIASIALPEERQEKARELIATGLSHAFTSPKDAKEVDVLAGMGPAKAFIESRAVDRARSQLMFMVTTSAVMVFAALGCVKYWVIAGETVRAEYLRAMLLGGMAGITGSGISWVQRCGDVEIDVYASRVHRTFQGGVRVMLGMVFGMIVVIAARSQFAFSIATGTPYALCMLALAGGFSERLVPDVISRVGEEQAAKNGAHAT